MRLVNFPFKATVNLPNFSNLLTSAIGGCSSKINKPRTQYDIIECWFYNWSATCIGRYLSHRKKKYQKLIRFWIGIEIKADEIRLIVWFKQIYNTAHWAQLKKAIQTNFCNSENYGNEIWVPLPEKDFKDFCNNNHQKVSKFVDDVLSKL